jgi:hypothetical protein
MNIKAILLFLIFVIALLLLVFFIVYFKKDKERYDNAFNTIFETSIDLINPKFKIDIYDFPLFRYNVVNDDGGVPTICLNTPCNADQYLQFLMNKTPNIENPDPNQRFHNNRASNNSYRELSTFQRQKVIQYIDFLKQTQFEWSVRSQADKINVFNEIINGIKSNDPSANLLNNEIAFPIIFPEPENTEPNLILYQYQLAFYSDPKFKSLMNDIINQNPIKFKRIFIQSKITDSLQDPDGNCENPSLVNEINQNKQFNGYASGLCEKSPRSRFNYNIPLSGNEYAYYNNFDSYEDVYIIFTYDDIISLFSWSPNGVWSSEFMMLLSAYNIYEVEGVSFGLDFWGRDQATLGDAILNALLTEAAQAECRRRGLDVNSSECAEIARSYIGLNCISMDPCVDPSRDIYLRSEQSFFNMSQHWDYYNCYTRGLPMPIIFPNNWLPMIIGNIQGEHNLRLPSSFASKSCGWDDSIRTNPGSNGKFINLFGEGQDKSFYSMFNNGVHMNMLIESMLDNIDPYTDTRFYDPYLNRFVVSQLTGLRKQDFNRRFNDAKINRFFNNQFNLQNFINGSENFPDGSIAKLRSNYIRETSSVQGWTNFCIYLRESFFDNTREPLFIPSAWYFYAKYAFSSNFPLNTTFIPILDNGILNANNVLLNKSLEQNMFPVQDPGSMSDFASKRGNCSCGDKSVSGCRAHAAIDFFGETNRYYIMSTINNKQLDINFKEVFGITDGKIVQIEEGFFEDICKPFDENMFPNGYQLCSVKNICVDCSDAGCKKCPKGYTVNKEINKCCKYEHQDICTEKECDAINKCPSGYSCKEILNPSDPKNPTIKKCCKQSSCSRPKNSSTRLNSDVCVNVNNESKEEYLGLCGTKNKAQPQYTIEDVCEPGYTCKGSGEGSCDKNGIKKQYPAIVIYHIDGLAARYGEFNIRYEHYNGSLLFPEIIVGSDVPLGVPVGKINQYTRQCHLEIYMGTNDILPWIEGGHPFINGMIKRNPYSLINKNWNLRGLTKINQLTNQKIQNINFQTYNKYLTQRNYPYTLLNPPYLTSLNLENPADLQKYNNIQQIITTAISQSTLPNNLYNQNIFKMRYVPDYFTNCVSNCPELKCPYQRRFDLINIQQIKNTTTGFKRNFNDINLINTNSWRYSEEITLDPIQIQP